MPKNNSAPDRLIVGPYTFRIVRDVRKMKADIPDDDCDGAVSFRSESVYINPACEGAAFITTIWHEAIHAALLNAGIDDKGEHEGWVEAVSNAVVQILRDNPWTGRAFE